METASAFITSWHSYPKIYALGHAYLKELFSDPVIVEEKIDGSQFSFGVFDGELKVRSKSVQLNLFAPEKMFLSAIDTVQRLLAEGRLVNGVTYRAEYLARPKHNALCYDRVPSSFLIGYDANDSHETYLSYADKKAQFDSMGLETVPLLYEGKIDNYEMFRELLETRSILGGQKIEGVVVKNYYRFGPDGKVLMGKFVSEEFKEIHRGDWKERNPNQKDLIQRIIDDYKTPARWNKSVFRMRDEGKLENSPKDIGLLLKEISTDVLAECEQEIKDRLFREAWKDIHRGITCGFPQFYKEQLAKSSFETVAPSDS